MRQSDEMIKFQLDNDLMISFFLYIFIKIKKILVFFHNLRIKNGE